MPFAATVQVWVPTVEKRYNELETPSENALAARGALSVCVIVTADRQPWTGPKNLSRIVMLMG